MDSRRYWYEPQADAGGLENRTYDGVHPSRRFFEIRVKGHLDRKWADWLGGLEVELLENGEMVLSGSIVDQAALMGILSRLHQLNLALRSVNEVRPGGPSGDDEE